MNSRELATTLAALRFYQEYATPVDRGNAEQLDERMEPMDDLEIDTLCMKLNRVPA